MSTILLTRLARIIVSSVVQRISLLILLAEWVFFGWKLLPYASKWYHGPATAAETNENGRDDGKKALKRDNDRHKMVLAANSRQINELTTSLKAVTNKLNAKTAELEDANSNAANEMAKMKGEVAELEAAFSKASNEANIANATIVEQNLALASATNASNVLQSEVAELKETISRKEVEPIALKTEVDEQDQAISNEKATTMALESTVGEQQKAISRLEVDTIALKAEVDEQKQENSNAKVKIIALRSEVDEQKQEISNVKVERDKFQSKVTEQDDANRQLKEELAAANENAATLRKGDFQAQDAPSTGFEAPPAAPKKAGQPVQTPGLLGPVQPGGGVSPKPAQPSQKFLRISTVPAFQPTTTAQAIDSSGRRCP